jgi:hypothetical protein
MHDKVLYKVKLNFIKNYRELISKFKGELNMPRSLSIYG